LQAVYSTSFARVAGTTSTVVVYTVPVGKVAVVRTMTAGWSVTARTPGLIQVFLAGGNSRVWVVNVAAAGSGSDQWEGNLVLPEGETIRLLAAPTPQVWFTASGFLLSVP